MRVLFILILIGVGTIVKAQQSVNGDFRSLGMSGGYMFNIDDAALNSNPSFLGWQKEQYQHTLAVNFRDLNLAAYAPLVDNQIDYFVGNFLDEEGQIHDETMNVRNLNAVFEFLESYWYGTQTYITYDTLVSREARQNFKDALTATNSFKLNNTIFGVTYTAQNKGVFSFKIGKDFVMRSQISEPLADLAAFGKTSTYFDTLVLLDGSHLANHPDNYTNQNLNQTYLAFSNDTLKIKDIMGSSHLQVYNTRYYAVGWGKEMPISKKNARLFLGGNVNLIEGLNYYEIKNNEGEIIISNFSKPEGRLGAFGNAGLGLSFSGSATLTYNENWFVSAGFNNLGWVNWKARAINGGIGVYSNANDNEEFANYNYGVSKTMFFNDQFEEADFNWREVTVKRGRASIFRATPANVHFGVKRQFGNIFAIGGNLITPINKNAVGNMFKTELSVNYELTLKKFTIFSGINNMNNTISMPIGFSIGSRKSWLETGVAISDILGYFDKNKTNNFSIGLGFKLRFK